MIKRLTLGHVRAILDATDVDLLDIGEPAVLDRVRSDAVWIGKAIAIAGGPTELAGEDLAAAGLVLMKRLIEFFPKRSVYDDFADDTKTSSGKADPWKYVFRAAGCAGVEPWGYTLRELQYMAQGAFEPHATIIADFRAAHAKEGEKAHDADTINPYHPKRPRPKRARKDAQLRKD